MTIEEILHLEEGQTFDRKSINIDPKALAISITSFANADGGMIAIGISDKSRRIEGVDYEIPKLNELLRVPFDFCIPTVNVKIEKIPCIDSKERKNHIIVMCIEPSMEVHANQADEVYMRVGDKSKKLQFEERIQLMYDKGERFFEDKFVQGADLSDLDMDFIQSYINRIGYSKTAIEYLKENKGFVTVKNNKLQISSAAILLFGKNPQLYFPRARIRFIRYEGIEEKVGTEMNVIKDVIFEGNILTMLNNAIAYVNTQIKEKTYLGENGIFITEEEYPKFVRQEIIVNAVTHRDYSIRGTDIQIKMFDDRIVVESPGKLPGLVRNHNIRHTHFSRNPKIAEFLRAYNFVKEYGEGVDRIYKEMELAGLQEPTYYSKSFILQTIISNIKIQKSEVGAQKSEVDVQKSEIGAQKSEVDVQKSKVGVQKSEVDVQKSEVDIQKISFESIKTVIEKQCFNEPTMEKLLKIYQSFDTNQIFGASDVQNILKCSISTASEIMFKLRKMQVILEIKGRGKGKYRFIYENEYMNTVL